MTTARRLAVLFLVAAMAAVLPAAAAATSSFLDPSFGINGVVTLDTSPDPAWATAVARQPDGKLVVAGTTKVFTGSDTVLVARLLASGQLDTTFASGGVYTLPNPGGAMWATGVVVQPDGKIVVSAGAPGSPDGTWVMLFRLDASGHRDLGFGASGVAHTPTGLNDTTRTGLALQADGKIVVGDDLFPATPGDANFMVARFNADGSADSTFGTGGVATADTSTAVVTNDDLGVSVAILPDGRIVVAGEVLGRNDPMTIAAGLASFTPTGQPDATFGNGGKLMLAFPAGVARFAVAKAVVAEPDGKLIVVAKAVTSGNPRGDRGQLVLTRLTGTGAFDPSFGTGGVTIVPDADGFSAALDGQGRIVVSGHNFDSDSTGRLMIARFLTNGGLDPSFGGSGIALTGDAGHYPQFMRVLVQPDGRPVAVGEVADHFTVVRYETASAVGSFGWNPVGELGTGTTTDAHSAATAVGLSGAVGVAAGAYHGLAMKADGSLWSFGWNALGQLGDGTTTDRHSPVPVSMPAPVTAVAAGVYHSLALGSDGIVRGFGWNGAGQLGTGTTNDAHAPIGATGLDGVVGIAAGAYHSLAVKSDGTVWAWGWNILGQLGDGTTTDRHSPVQVNGLTSVVAVAAGAYSSLALKSDGTVWFWGWNGAGQAGDGTTINHLTPVQVPGLTGVTAIASGYYHSLALKTDGTVRAWGWNSTGELGDGTTTLRLSPVTVSGLTGVTSISGGAFHSLAARSNGTVVAWGWNGVGQLGTGTTTDSLLAVAVPGITGATAVSAGLAQSLVVHGA